MGRVLCVFCFTDIITHISAALACSCSSSFSFFKAFFPQNGDKVSELVSKSISWLFLFVTFVADKTEVHRNDTVFHEREISQGEVISFIRSAETAGKKQVVFQACSAFSRFDKDAAKSKHREGNEMTFLASL